MSWMSNLIRKLTSLSLKPKCVEEYTISNIWKDVKWVIDALEERRLQCEHNGIWFKLTYQDIPEKQQIGRVRLIYKSKEVERAVLIKGPSDFWIWRFLD